MFIVGPAERWELLARSPSSPWRPIHLTPGGVRIGHHRPDNKHCPPDGGETQGVSPVLQSSMLLLSEPDLRAVLSMRDVIDAVELGFRSIALGNVKIPERLTLDLPSQQAILLAMPASADLNGVAALGTKIVSVFQNN